MVKRKKLSLSKERIRTSSIDMLRGFGIILMLITHINGMFLLGNQKPLDYITYAGATVCFSIFLFCFGYGYGHKLGSKQEQSFPKALYRIILLYFVYLLSAIIISFLQKSQITISDIWKIASFENTPVYTEFMIPFIIYTVFMLPIYQLIKKPLWDTKKKTVFLLVAFQILSFFLYIVSYLYAERDFFSSEIIQKLIIGKKDVTSFPILPYSPIFIFGLIWGYLLPSRKLAKRHEKLLIRTVFISFTLATIILKLLDLSSWERFPPSIFYLFIGISVISGFLTFKKLIRKARFIKKYLVFLGKNSLLIFFLNVIIIGVTAFLLNFKKFDTNSTLFLNIFIISLISFKVWSVSKLKLLLKSPNSKILLAIAFLIFILTAFLTFFLSEKKLKDLKGILITPEEKIEIDYCQNFDTYPTDMFKVSTDKKWILTGELPEQITNSSEIQLTVEFDQQYKNYLQGWDNLNISYFIPETDVFGIFTKSSTEFYDTNKVYYTSTVDLSELSVNSYNFWITVHMPCELIKIVSDKIFISEPLYISWTQDWEGGDVPQQYLNDIDEISKNYEIPITHFFNPRIYQTNVMSSYRSDQLTNWIKRRRDQNGDNIGLHLHMYPDTIMEALKKTATERIVQKEIEETDENGIITKKIVDEVVLDTIFPVRYEPRWGGYTQDSDIPVSAYTYEELKYIFSWASDVFESKGLGRPNGFRAGGWFADEDVLLALQDSGFHYDSSGRTFEYRGTNKMKLQWELKETTQPYKPNVTDQNSSVAPNLKIWEFPNNGADSWVYSDKDMIERFNLNWDGNPLKEKKLVVYLSHPHWFYVDKPKMNAVFSHIDQFAYSKDRGPVIYINLDTAYEIWEKQVDEL